MRLLLKTSCLLLSVVMLSGSVYGSDKEDDQFYDYSKVKASNAKTIKEKTDFLSAYMQKYPNGSHTGEMKALLEQAQEDLAKWEAEMQVGSILVDCRITLGSGQTIPVQGWIQLIKIDKSAVLACLQAIENDEIATLQKRIILEFPKKDGKAEDYYWYRVGEVISKNLRGEVLARGQISEGKVEFSNLQPSYYLIYGAGLGGKNFVMYFSPLDVKTGKIIVIKEPFGSVVNPDLSLQSWKPL